MKRFLPFIIVAAVALLTVGAGGMLYRAKRPSALAIPKNAKASDMNGAEVHTRGETNAPVTLQEFGDFQCPPCGGLAPVIDQLEKEYKSRLRTIFSHYPLPMHQHAFEAAVASEAASAQGRFWEMHDLLYREQANWSKAPDARALFIAYAGVLGLNLERFKKDMESKEVKQRVVADQKRGAELGVNTTPSIFINDRAVPASSLNPAALREAVKAALESKPAAR